MGWPGFGNGQGRAGARSEHANGAKEWWRLDFAVCAEARAAVPGQRLARGVRNKNGESRRWGRRMNAAGGTLWRLRAGRAKGMRPGPLRRCCLSGASGDTDVDRALLAASATPGPRGHYQRAGEGCSGRCAAEAKGRSSSLPRRVSAGGGSRVREGGSRRAGHEPGRQRPRRGVRHELRELRQRETPPVADRPDRQRQVPRAGVGERGEEHLPHPLEARGQAGLQPRGGRRPLQGY